MNEKLLEKAVKSTREIHRNRYFDAAVIFLAGSIVRGEETAASDLDLVVIYEKLPAAFRESFYFDQFPVEVFAHDLETLNYFIGIELEQGYSPLLNMVSEGIEIPERNEYSARVKQVAARLEHNNLLPLSAEKINQLRYSITNLIDDLRFPRSKYELTATGTELYGELANFCLRSNNFRTAKNKTIPRMLEKNGLGIQKRFCEAFEDLFIKGETEAVIRLTEEVLEKHGGFLFEGYKSIAPENWRKPLV